MDIIHCSNEEWQDSQRMFITWDTALSYLGYVQPQCAPMVPKCKYTFQSLRHIYDEGRCIGYVEE